MSLTERLKQRAREIGFDLVGITSPDPPPHAAFYADWIAAGYHGEMAYLATERAVERRAEPRKILPECQSVVVVGVSYWPSPPDPLSRREKASPPDPLSRREKQPTGEGEQSPGREEPTPPSSDRAFSRSGEGGWEGEGRVARYAWGVDYHDVLPRKMAELVASIESEVGQPVKHKIYTDTGPILERDLAQRAGLGWSGKNTMLINPQIGSWTLLGELLLDLELDPDPPFEHDRCGKCTRCIDACPTDAILDNRTLDARRCISYLTIELKGEVPTDLRAEIGDWVFGCDVCQEVCPWNSKIQNPKSKPQNPSVPLDELLQMTEAEFRERFGHTALSRPKLRGMKRNAAVVAENLRRPSGER